MVQDLFTLVLFPQLLKLEITIHFESKIKLYIHFGHLTSLRSFFLQLKDLTSWKFAFFSSLQ